MSSAWRHLDYPAVVAHRGYAARYPENTIVALAAAVAGGARFLEFDIQLSRDEVPLLCHDDNLQRVAGRSERIFDLDWRELRGIRAGEPQRFGTRFETLPLASLKDTVAHLNRWPQTVSFVEIKRHSVERFGVECTVDRVLADLAAARWPFVVISFDADVVAYARSQGCARTGWVLRNWDEKHRTGLTNLAPEYVFCNGEKIPDDEPLWQGRWHWVIYEVTTPAVAEHWRSRGAALVESMAPAALLGAKPFDQTRTNRA